MKIAMLFLLALAVPAWGQQPIVSVFEGACPSGWHDIDVTEQLPVSVTDALGFIPADSILVGNQPDPRNMLGPVVWCKPGAGKAKPKPKHADRIDSGTDSNCTGLENQLCYSSRTDLTRKPRPQPDADGVIWTREPVTQLVPSCPQGEKLQRYVPTDAEWQSEHPLYVTPEAGWLDTDSPNADITFDSKYRCVPVHPQPSPRSAK